MLRDDTSRLTVFTISAACLFSLIVLRADDGAAERTGSEAMLLCSQPRTDRERSRAPVLLNISL